MSDTEKTTSVAVFVGLLLVFANAGMQYLLWFGDQGLVRWRQTQKQSLAIKEDVRQVERRIQQLKDEILLIEQEPVALEEVARRDLGMVYPDEILFIVPDK